MKVIALRTLKGCLRSHLKALKEDEIYYFYNTYDIVGNKIINNSIFGENFFLPYSKTLVNLNVVVGKNGSGKSSLIDLMIKIINNFSFRQGFTRADLMYVNGIKAELIFKTDTYYRIRVSNKFVTAYKYNKRTKNIDSRIDIRSLQNSFFYSIVVNHSHYAYNAKPDDPWLNGLFSKNDGYLTPIVLNPYRVDGNININIENQLINTRLIANFMLKSDNSENHFRRLTPKFTARYLKLTLKDSKGSKELYTIFEKGKSEPTEVTLNDLEIDHHKLLRRLNTVIPFSYTILDKQKYKLALEYLVYKMVSIAVKYYNHHRLYFNKQEFKFVDHNLTKFFEDLKKDHSHITLKLRQTINFLRLRQLQPKDQTIDLEKYTRTVKKIGVIRRHWSVFEIAELNPPPIFNIEILMDGSSEPVSFNTLSSGEKQLIYSVSSVLYHLANLNSIYRSFENRFSYQWVNVILEEVELYAHPDMQRKFVKYLLDSIDHLQLRILGINICIVTHSPFVLSDVPHHNVLFLQNDDTKIENTEDFRVFAANIYDLLAHAFFLKEGALGEFAQERLQRIIDFLRGINMSGREKALYEKECFETIKVIGEPLLREKLLEDYNRLVRKGNYEKIEFLKLKIQQLSES